MKSVTRDNGNNQSFDWDGVGNRAGSTIYGDSSTYSRDPDSNRLVSVNGANARSFGYDAVGTVNADTRGSLTYTPSMPSVDSTYS